MRGGIEGGGNVKRSCEALALCVSATSGAGCIPNLNQLLPWIDKIWSLKPYFPNLVKERHLQNAELVKV